MHLPATCVHLLSFVATPSHGQKEQRRWIVDEIRWDEKAGLRTGCGVRSQVIDVLKAQINKETGNEEG